MNIEQAKKEFERYVNNYDMNNPKIKLKYGHSFRVMERAGEIAESLNLNNEEIELAKLIGLLHDIGRFEQIRIYKTYSDIKSIDHGDLGVEILKKDKYIRKYIEDEKYDNIILKAIINHNKYAIEAGLDEKELLFSKIVRDADKIDIFYIGTEFLWKTNEEIEKVEQSHISPDVISEFKDRVLIKNEKKVTPLDDLISFIAYVFDLTFDYSLEYIKQQKYIDNILNKFNFDGNALVKKQIEQIKNMIYV